MRIARLAPSLLAVHALIAGAAAAQAPAAPSTARARHVVLVVSAAGRDLGRTAPGFEQDELSQAWVLVTRSGYRVTIASPTGGAVVADEFSPRKDYNAAFFADSATVAQLRNTRRATGMAARDVDAVMVIGGKGAMFDLPLDTALARLVGQVYDRGGVVSAVCHGPAGLLRARTRDGRLLVAGRAKTGFSDGGDDLRQAMASAVRVPAGGRGAPPRRPLGRVAARDRNFGSSGNRVGV
jgi:putative intracellular protease/amidase